MALREGKFPKWEQRPQVLGMTFKNSVRRDLGAHGWAYFLIKRELFFIMQPAETVPEAEEDNPSSILYCD